MGQGAVSSLIRWGTDSPYSHVAVVASERLKLIIEAVPHGGVRAISVENYKTPYDIFRVKKPESYNLNDVVGYLVRMLARNYDFESTRRLAWRFLLKKIGLIQLAVLKATNQKEKADSLQQNQDYFCSELCYLAFKAGGLDIVPQIADAEVTSPADIAASPLIQKVN